MLTTTGYEKASTCFSYISVTRRTTWFADLRETGRWITAWLDAAVATAGLLSQIGLLRVVQGYWTEHSERAVLPTGLAVIELPPTDKDILGCWKPEGSDTYAQSYGNE